MNVYLLHGVNLNLLGTREPSKYGSRSLLDLITSVRSLANTAGLDVIDFQSNSEGEMVDYIHALPLGAWVVFNAGAWTHTSVALRDAISSRDLRLVEVHITQVHAREQFRHRSYLSSISRACISGAGLAGYDSAIDFIGFQEMAA